MSLLNKALSIFLVCYLTSTAAYGQFEEVSSTERLTENHRVKEISYWDLVDLLETKDHQKQIVILAFDSSDHKKQKDLSDDVKKMSERNLSVTRVDFVSVDLDKINEDYAREYVRNTLFRSTIPGLRIISKDHRGQARAKLDTNIYSDVIPAAKALKLKVDVAEKQPDGPVKYPSVAELKEEMESAPNATFVVVFYATWCGPCRQYDSVVKTFAKNPEIDGDIRVRKIDIDKEDSAEMDSIGYPEGASLPQTNILRAGVVKTKDVGMLTKDVIVGSVKGILGAVGSR